MEAATKTTTAATTYTRQGALDRDLYCPRLERLLMGAASELGQRGNLAQVVATIERGGASGGGEDPNLSMLRRLGATDTRGIDGRVRQLTELERRFRMLTTKQQATALAHYLGTPRAHATLRERFGSGQGGLAGVVLYRWQLKQDKARARGEQAGGTKIAEELERVRAELAPLEREMATVTAVLDAPLPDLGEPPTDPGPAPLVLRLKHLRTWAGQQRRADRRAWLAPLRQAQQRRQVAAQRQLELAPMLPPLRATQARLCAALADLAAVGSAVDDEEALVRVCRSGNLDPAPHLAGAEQDVRALHRAWQAAGKASRESAKAWANEGDAA